MKSTIYKFMTAVATGLLAFLMLSGSASAHVVVKPAEALTGSFQTFVVSAPNEKTIPFTTIKLDIPDGVQSVTPTAKAGWVITMDKTGEGETASTKSITWTGSVDAGLRDEFSFSTKLPDTATELEWKAYQIYADGTTVAWDQKQASDDDSAGSGPLSVTKVVTESSADTAATKASDKAQSAQSTAQVALYVAIAGLIVTTALLAVVVRKK